jgi:hypothetical protein
MQFSRLKNKDGGEGAENMPAKRVLLAAADYSLQLRGVSVIASVQLEGPSTGLLSFAELPNTDLL